MCSWIKDSSGLSQDCVHDTVRIPAQDLCTAQVQGIGEVLLTSYPPEIGEGYYYPYLTAKEPLAQRG